MKTAWAKADALQRTGTDCVVITITATRGSVPGEVGGKAVVTGAGLDFGNLGGGRVEARAIAEAQDILATNAPLRHHTWNLQKDIGMTCGGEMSLLFEPLPASPPWHIVLFGAGHIAQALVPVLATMDCKIDVIDERLDWLEQLPQSVNLTTHDLPSFAEGAKLVAPESYVLCITKGHATDRPVLAAALQAHTDLPFIGAIGSKSKRATLFRELADDGIPAELLEQIVCPLGLPLGTNAPAEIAISIAAQLLHVRDNLKATSSTR